MKKIFSIQASKFKTHCLQLMDEAQAKHISITITKHGKPVAKLVPIENKEHTEFFGCLKDTVTINGNIVAPVDTTWETITTKSL